MLVKFWVIVLSVVVLCQVGQCFNFPQRLGVAKVALIAVKASIAPKVLIPARSGFKLSAYDSMSEQKVAELTQDVRKLKSDMQSVIWIFRGLASLGAVLVCGTMGRSGGSNILLLVPVCHDFSDLLCIFSRVIAWRMKSTRGKINCKH